MHTTQLLIFSCEYITCSNCTNLENKRGRRWKEGALQSNRRKKSENHGGGHLRRAVIEMEREGRIMNTKDEQP